MKGWMIEITDGTARMGACVTVPMWDVLSCLASYRAALPAGWTAEAYPAAWGRIGR